MTSFSTPSRHRYKPACAPDNPPRRMSRKQRAAVLLAMLGVLFSPRTSVFVSSLLDTRTTPPPTRSVPNPVLDLGELPMVLVGAAVGADLEPGRVRLSRRVSGQERNVGMLRRIARPDGRVVLVAIGLERDGGPYRVRGCYLVTAETVNVRRLAGRLRVVLPP